MRIEQLGAHLEAYVDTLPTITTLRLCNGFGTGNDCQVNRLPIELIKLIEEHIVVPEREDALVTYSKAIRCCEGTCEPIDHFTQEEMCESYHRHYGCLDAECTRTTNLHRKDHVKCKHDACDGNECPAWKYDHQLDLRVYNQLKELSHFQGHEDRCIDSQDLLLDLPIATDQDELLKSNFEISVSAKMWRPKVINGATQNFTSAAYLTLPGNILRTEEWEDGGETDLIGFGMPVAIPAPPTEQSLSRFPRALKILGLQAWSHPGLRNQPILSPPVTGEDEREIGEKDVVQPQLTFLVETGWNY